MKTNDKQPRDEKKQDWTKTLPEVSGGKSVFDGMIPPEDAGAFAGTSKSNYRLFNDKKAPGHRLPPILLQSVARGEQDKAASILTSCPYLLSHRGDVTDYSGRTFKNITAFQYALWAMDTHMCRMILDAIPPGPTGDALRADLIHQYEKLEADGVTYELEGQTYTNQHHFDFSPLIAALQYYVDHVDGWLNTQPPNWAEMERQWCTQVGLAQRYVPAHVAQEYCHPTRSFHPTPKFNERGLERSLTFHNYRKGTDMVWWPKVGSSSGVLGVDFGIWRDALGPGGGWAAGRMAGLASPSLAAVTALCEVRTADLKQTLEILKRGPDPELGSGGVIS